MNRFIEFLNDYADCIKLLYVLSLTLLPVLVISICMILAIWYRIVHG